MNHHSHNASVPEHRYGFVDRSILRGLDPDEAGKFEPAVIFGVTSIPSRALHFSILCESGAQWARIPLHMLRHELPEADAPVHELGHFLGDVEGLAKEAKLPAEVETAVIAASEALFTAFDKIDVAIHGTDDLAKVWSEEAAGIEAGMKTLKDAVTK
jgi:hypothetical protein